MPSNSSPLSNVICIYVYPIDQDKREYKIPRGVLFINNTEYVIDLVWIMGPIYVCKCFVWTFGLYVVLYMYLLHTQFTHYIVYMYWHRHQYQYYLPVGGVDGDFMGNWIKRLLFLSSGLSALIQYGSVHFIHIG